MHLASHVQQTVRIDGLELTVSFAQEETTHTENSYKHDDTTLQELTDASGFRIEKKWTDARHWFVDLYCVAV